MNALITRAIIEMLNKGSPPEIDEAIPPAPKMILKVFPTILHFKSDLYF